MNGTGTRLARAIGIGGAIATVALAAHAGVARLGGERNLRRQPLLRTGLRRADHFLELRTPGRVLPRRSRPPLLALYHVGLGHILSSDLPRTCVAIAFAVPEVPSQPTQSTCGTEN